MIDEETIEHLVPLTGLRPFSYYIYRVRSADGEGNQSAWKGSFFITLSRPDDDPPITTSGPQAFPTVNRAQVVWDTSELGSSFVQYSLNPDFSDGINVTEAGPSVRHRVWLENLEPNTTYYYRVRSVDTSGNASALRTGHFRTVGSNEEPVFTQLPKVTQRTPFKAWIEWKTSGPSTSRVNFGQSEAYGRFAASADLVQHHKILLISLDAQTLYHFQAVSVDASGNVVESADQTFVTRGNEDVHPPGIQRRPWVVLRGTDRCTIGWQMDEPSNGWLEYGLSNDYGQRVEISEFDRDFRVTASGLAPGKTYHGRFHMVDLEGNGPTRSEDFTFVTASSRDRSAPLIESPPWVVRRTDTSVTIGFVLSEAGDGRIEFGEGLEFDRAALDIEFSREHLITVTGLEPGKTYRGRVLSTDAFGNGPVESEVFEFSTRLDSDTIAPVIYTGPAIVDRSHDSAVIACQTDELAELIIEYGTDTSYGQQIISDQPSTNHAVSLSNLTPETKYHLQVSATDLSGNGPTFSRDLNFRTKKKKSKDPKGPKIRQISVRKVSESTALIEWKTDKPADSAVDYGVTDAYGERVEDPVLSRDHQMRLSGLEPNTLYHFRVASQRLDGGESESADRTLRTTSERDSTPPVVVRRPELNVSHSTATIRWRTDEPCFYLLRVGTESTMGTVAERIFESARAQENHNVTLTGLERGTRYVFVLILRDLDGNETVIGGNGAAKVVAPVAQGGEISFTTDVESDLKAPAIVDGPRLAAQSSTEALITWSTDEIGDSQLLLEREGLFELVESIPEHEFDHRIFLSDLEPGTTYRVRVASTDPVGNGPGRSEVFSFTTSAIADIAAPQIVAQPQVVAVSDRLATVIWETDEASTAEVLFGVDELNLSASDPQLATRHRVELANLQPNTTYSFKARSFDALENGPVESGGASFKTELTPDTQAPELVGVPQIESFSDRSAVIIWETDEAADAFVHYGAGESLDQVFGRVELGMSHRVVLAKLEPNTTYRFKAASVDLAGNGPTESAELSLTTLAEPDQTAPAVPGDLTGSSPGAGPVDLRWQEVSDDDVVGYNVYRAPGTEDFGLLAGPVAAATYLDHGLVEPGEYRYRITAVDRVGNESDASAEIAVAVDLRGKGDFLGDGRVGLDDFFVFAERFGSELGADDFGEEYDFDGDGRIGFGDFFVFVDLFGTDYSASRAAPLLAPGPAPFEAELSLHSEIAGDYAVEIRGLDLDGLRGYGLRFRYEEQALRLLRAEGTDTELFSVLEDRSGVLVLGGYRLDASVLNGEKVLARLFFTPVSGAAPAILRLEAVAASRDGVFESGRLEQVQLHLVPADYALLPNVPNPFNPQTEIRFQLPVSGPVSLRLYDVLGREVALLSEGYKTAGYHRLSWDGRDAQGRPAASGVYFSVLEAERFRQVRKLMLLR